MTTNSCEISAGLAAWIMGWLGFRVVSKQSVAVLESLPSGSQVLVDGQAMGLTPLTTTLSAGPHRIDFKYRAKTRTVDIVVAKGGRTNELVAVQHVLGNIELSRRQHFESDLAPGAPC